jgi:pilus assembly protein CpaC
VTIDGYLIPAISSRVAETEVVLRDGESFAIAGLIDNRVTQELNKISILGDIPILGQLFRSHSTSKSVDELLVVVTPHFVKPVPPGEELRLPTTVVPYLLPIAPKKGKNGTTQTQTSTQDNTKPQFVGPQGYVLPKQQQ